MDMQDSNKTFVWDYKTVDNRVAVVYQYIYFSCNLNKLKPGSFLDF